MTVSEGTGRSEEVAAALVRDEPALVSSLDFGPRVRQGIGPGPSVWIGDPVGIPLIAPKDAGFLDHRLAPLARDGDCVMVRRRAPEFEAYLADCLGVGDISYIDADAESVLPVAAQCRSTTSLFDALTAALRAGNSITLQPYVAHGHVWRLAAELGTRTGLDVYVAGPGPRIMRRSNDKLWFWDLARRTVGAGSVPPTWAAYGPAAAAGHVARLVRQYGQAVVKVPDSAGAAGNLRIDASGLPSRSPLAIRELLVRQLAALGWEGAFPVLVGVWESGVTRSPSAQVWIPAQADGPPAVLGLFEQVVEGEAGAFIGARPARLPPALETRMIAEASAIGRVLQNLGYFGPCSLDAVISSGPEGLADLHWIECNGRWSGVSIPLSVARRWYHGRIPGGLVILQEKLVAPGISSTSGLVAALADLLLRKSNSEGLVLMSPANPGWSRFNAFAMAATQPRAEEIARAALARLTASR